MLNSVDPITTPWGRRGARRHTAGQGRPACRRGARAPRPLSSHAPAALLLRTAEPPRRSRGRDASVLTPLTPDRARRTHGGPLESIVRAAQGASSSKPNGAAEGGVRHADFRFSGGEAAADGFNCRSECCHGSPWLPRQSLAPAVIAGPEGSAERGCPVHASRP